jgi:hypothetical protein
MAAPELRLSIRTPSQIRAMEFPAANKYLPSGIFAKGQPFGIVGPAAVGKSRLLLQLAVCVITGRPFLGWPVEKHDVKWLIVQTENGSARLQHDLNAMAAFVGEKAFRDMDRNIRLHTLETEHDSFLSLDDSNNAILIEGAIYEHKPDIVVFDPLNAFSAGNLNTDAGMLQTCRGLHRLATLRNPDTTVVILHHSLAGKAGMRKAVGLDAGGYGKGSKAFVQWTRGQLNIAPGSDKGGMDLVIACGKNSNGPWFEPFGAMFDPVTGVYEVNPHFDLESWKASVGIAPLPPQRKLNAAAVAELAGPLPISKGELAERIMIEYAVAKTRAYEVINQAEAAKTIVRDARKLYRAAPADAL